MTKLEKKELEAIVEKNIHDGRTRRRDICTIYSNAGERERLVKLLAEPFRGEVDYVAAPESLGFMLGAFLAAELGVGFIPIRTGNAWLEPEDCIRSSYVDHRDQPRSLQVRKSNLPMGSRILLADDWIESGVTVQTCIALMEERDCDVVGIATFGAAGNAMTRKLIETGLLYAILYE